MSVNYINDTTKAYISQYTLTNVAGVTVDAENSSLIVAVSGGAAVSTQSGTNRGWPER